MWIVIRIANVVVVTFIVVAGVMRRAVCANVAVVGNGLCTVYGIQMRVSVIVVIGVVGGISVGCGVGRCEET